jgi:Fuc2NAc and GlcNAc transferase
MTLVFLAATLVATLLLTAWLRRFALSRRMVDVPNARSSHAVPTPRGGGVAIVLVVLAALPLLEGRGMLPVATLWALLGGGALVGLIGWLDDHGNVAARWRLLAHSAAALWALAWLGGLMPLPVFGTVVDFGWVGHALAFLYLVWLINLYNFMDGIDGIAGIEAVTVCLGGVLLFRLSSVGADEWMVPLLLASAVSGFLVWNFPRARIFMGDAGSGFVGLMLGLLSLRAGWLTPELFWGWVILLGVFVVDATTTLLRRLVRGERVYEAHCSHAYQRESRRLGSHVPVSLAIGGINLLWLLPVAAMVVSGRIDGAFGFILAYAPLVGLAIHCQAGKAE